MKFFCICEFDNKEKRADALLKKAIELQFKALRVHSELICPKLIHSIKDNGIVRLGKEISSKEDLFEHNMQYINDMGIIEDEMKSLYQELSLEIDQSNAEKIKSCIKEVEVLLKAMVQKMMPIQESFNNTR